MGKQLQRGGDAQCPSSVKESISFSTPASGIRVEDGAEKLYRENKSTADPVSKWT
jgi:hypothetical protein